MCAPDWLAYRMESLRAGVEREVGSDAQWQIIKTNGVFLSFAPRTRIDVVHREYHHYADIDELGGRQTQLDSNCTTRVVFCGDSFTFGVGVSNADTFISRLQKASSARLVNLGVPGSALPNHRFIIEHRHRELGSPPLYFFCFFLGNDFADIYKAHLQQKTKPVARNRSALRGFAEKVNRFVLKSALRRSYLIQFVRRPFVERMRRRSSDSAVDPIFLMMNPQNQGYRSEVIDYLNEELSALNKLAEQLRFRAVFILIPDKHQVSSLARTRRAQMYGLDPATLDPLLPNKTLAPLLTAHGFSLIDPTEAFLANARPDEFYYVYDNHFTRAGHSFFAGAITREFSQTLRETVGGGTAR